MDVSASRRRGGSAAAGEREGDGRGDGGDLGAGVVEEGGSRGVGRGHRGAGRGIGDVLQHGVPLVYARPQRGYDFLV